MPLRHMAAPAETGDERVSAALLSLDGGNNLMIVSRYSWPASGGETGAKKDRDRKRF